MMCKKKRQEHNVNGDVLRKEKQRVLIPRFSFLSLCHFSFVKMGKNQIVHWVAEGNKGGHQ
jgi:hypothetical protein